MPLIDHHPEKDYKTATLFSNLWEKTLGRRIDRKIQDQQDNATVLEIITHEIGEFLRTFPFHKRLKLKAEAKDDAKAHEARKSGNERYGQPGSMAYMQALPYYNESIALSPPGSEARALAYGNRSLLCMKACMYEECLENIRLARAANCPAHLAEKLTKRERQVKRLLEEEREIFGPPENPPGTPGKFPSRDKGRPTLQLSYEAHATVPHLVRHVELRRNDAFGRHLVAKRKLKAGDVLMIDTPYANLLLDGYRHVRCAFCHREESFTLIPCEGCTVAMYCSEECRTEAKQQYHRYECGVLHDLWRLVGDMELGMMGLRIVAKAFASHDQDLDGWVAHLAALDHAKVDACTVDWTKATATEVYDTMHVLETNESQRGHFELAQIAFFTTIMHRLMLERTELGKLCEEKPARSKLLFDLLFRHWQTAFINSKHLLIFNTLDKDDDFGGSSDDDGDDENWSDCESVEPPASHLKAKTPGWACYPLLSMLNHNCTPNVIPIFLPDGRCAIVANRPIAANEQLFDHYAVSSLDVHFVIRCMILKDKYFFMCRCAACKTGVRGELADTSAAEERLMKMFHVMGNEEHQLPMLLRFMNRPDRYYPKNRMTATQMHLLYVFRVLYNCSEQDEMMDMDKHMARFIFAGLSERV